MNKEQLTRKRKKEQQAWLEANLDDIIEFSNSRNYSSELVASAIQEVFDEDIRQIITGKRSK